MDLDLQLIELFYLIDEIQALNSESSYEGYSRRIDLTLNEEKKTILLEFGFSTYEEHCETDITCQITEDGKIVGSESVDGYSCYGGDYKYENTIEFASLKEFIDYIRSENL